MGEEPPKKGNSLRHRSSRSGDALGRPVEQAEMLKNHAGRKRTEGPVPRHLSPFRPLGQLFGTMRNC